MSVNLILDGTTYEGATTITVGGKTISIDEVSGGGSGVAHGTFTPESNTLNLSWDMGGEYENIVIRKASNTLGYGVRTCLMNAKIGSLTSFVGTNSTGTTGAGGTGNSEITINGSTVTYAGGANAGSGYLVAEQYDWYAW